MFHVKQKYILMTFARRLYTQVYTNIATFSDKEGV